MIKNSKKKELDYHKIVYKHIFTSKQRFIDLLIHKYWMEICPLMISTKSIIVINIPYDNQMKHNNKITQTLFISLSLLSFEYAEKP